MLDRVFQFEEFRLDCSAFELTRNDHPLRIERKPMELLILLASRQGQLVTRAEIAERLWSSEVFVDTEHGINTAIRKLRHILHDDPDEPKFIQTVTGMGYRFIAPVSLLEPASPAAPASEISVLDSAPPQAQPEDPRRGDWGWYAAAVVCAIVALGGASLYRLRHHPVAATFTQLTDFTDSAVQPALSPDGRMLAFIRGGDTFMTSDQIYVRMLPNGEARRVTNDNRPKYALAFSPDGSQIAYTVIEGPVFSTYEVSVLGGEPQLMQRNAAGLVWLSPQRLLFSEAPSGIHLSVVTASLTGADQRNIYSPPHERGMAHYSFPSPDRRWAIVVEMIGPTGEWGPCRLVALEGQSPSRTIGPSGACTSAGWSPDGEWMYFTADVHGRSHIWRQHFPEEEPEQITFGAAEEYGIAVEPGGHSLITSSGIQESAIWIHDKHGDRSLSSEGEVLWWPAPIFSHDGSAIYYLLKRDNSAAQLWRTQVDTGASEPVFPGTSMEVFDISPDGKEVLYAAKPDDGTDGLWLAPLDRSSLARKLPISGAITPRFGGHGQILFVHAESKMNYLEKIDPDGTHMENVIPYPILDLQNISPGGRWATVGLPRTRESDSPTVAAVPLDGGPPVRVCLSYCIPKWSTDDKFLFVSVESGSSTSPGQSLAIPVGPDESLSSFPAKGIPPGAPPSIIKGASLVPCGDFVPGIRLGQHHRPSQALPDLFSLNSGPPVCRPALEGCGYPKVACYPSPKCRW